MAAKEEKKNQAAPVEEPKPKHTEAVQPAAEPEAKALVVKTMDEMFEEDAGDGLQGVGASDRSIPFFALLQKGSPQVDDTSPKYIKYAAPGAFLNTVTQEVFDGKQDGMIVIPCFFRKSKVEWKDRDSGGGLVAHHNEGDPILKKCTLDPRGRLVVPETGNIIVDTAYHFVLRIREGGLPEWGIISMTSTQLKKSRAWNTQMGNVLLTRKDGSVFVAPSYSRMYKITTVGEAKDKYTWYGYKIEPAGPVEDPNFYQMAKSFAKAVAQNQVKISAPGDNPDDAADVADDSEKVPF